MRIAAFAVEQRPTEFMLEYQLARFLRLEVTAAPQTTGSANRINQRRIERFGLNLKPGRDFEVVNPEDDPRYRDYVSLFHSLVGRSGVTPDTARTIDGWTTAASARPAAECRQAVRGSAGGSEVPAPTASRADCLPQQRLGRTSDVCRPSYGESRDVGMESTHETRRQRCTRPTTPQPPSGSPVTASTSA